mgnify:CR=1 FL=1
MSKNRSSFLKRDREARKNEKRAVKRQRRDDRKRGDQQDGVPQEGVPQEGDPQNLSTTASEPQDTLGGSIIDKAPQTNDSPPQF